LNQIKKPSSAGEITELLNRDVRAAARVVYIDPENALHCGIELAVPRNIWGVPLPPDDWEETGTL